jgi:hypothetical protein
MFFSPCLARVGFGGFVYRRDQRCHRYGRNDDRPAKCAVLRLPNVGATVGDYWFDRTRAGVRGVFGAIGVRDEVTLCPSMPGPDSGRR